eukprot:c45338_g1_i1 orf=1-207(-)
MISTQLIPVLPPQQLRTKLLIKSEVHHHLHSLLKQCKLSDSRSLLRSSPPLKRSAYSVQSLMLAGLHLK